MPGKAKRLFLERIMMEIIHETIAEDHLFRCHIEMGKERKIMKNGSLWDLISRISFNKKTETNMEKLPAIKNFPYLKLSGAIIDDLLFKNMAKKSTK